MSRPVVAGLAVLAALGLAILIAWGGGALVVYLFFAGIALAVILGAGVGGRWLEDSSRGRFGGRERD